MALYLDIYYREETPDAVAAGPCRDVMLDLSTNIQIFRTKSLPTLFQSLQIGPLHPEVDLIQNSFFKPP